jgi:formate dehydrogenase iron-sulfur subunit
VTLTRREFLKRSSGAVLGSAFLLNILPVCNDVPTENTAAGDSASMLYDGSICVGCRACQMACKNRSDRPLPPVTDEQALYEEPQDLSANVWTLIKLYRSEEGKEFAFFKAQCMHCLEPACASVCPVGALEKTSTGPVVYHAERCLGCRYCMAACPFGIPRYQWSKTWPLVQKCDFCAARQVQGLQPACSQACPTGALVYGKRGNLLSAAETRIQDHPREYVNYVYGKDEVGGTAMLYLSKVPFEKLGLPKPGTGITSQITWPYLLAVPGIIVVVGSLMTAIYATNQRKLKEA